MALTSKGSSKTRAKFTLADGASKLTLNPEHGESVWLGERPNDGEEVLVHQVGIVMAAMPVYVIGSAIAAGKVFSPDEVVSVFAETGKLAGLKKAIEAHEKREARRTAAAATTPPA